jgi:hypothetical protein
MNATLLAERLLFRMDPNLDNEMFTYCAAKSVMEPNVEHFCGSLFRLAMSRCYVYSQLREVEQRLLWVDE